MDTPLHASLDRHLDALISAPEGDLEAALEKCLRESSSSWSAVGHIGPLLLALRDLRSKRPQGMSHRPRKRKAVVNRLVAEVHGIREAQEREWWKEIATYPITAVVEKLRNIPDEHLDAALDSLLQLPASYPHILNEQIHHFFRRAHSRLCHLDRIAEPVVVAHLGCLVANGEYVAARELLERFPVTDQSALDSVVAYLRYVIERPVNLSGCTSYSTLSKADLFLGACYYPYRRSASPTLATQLQWDYGSVKRAFVEKGPDGALNDFKVTGLQPRIAELAFHHVYGLLHGANAQDKLQDLNLECVTKLTPPWSLDRKPNLPPADWEGGNGETYDVKSNLFYRSQQRKNGLRGFLIEIKRSNTKRHSFPGFVFTDTDEDSCSWVYVGEYQPTPSMGQIGDRVLPFCFRLPDSVRFIPSSTNCDPGLGMELLNDPWLRIGWQLAAVMQVPPKPRERTIAESLLDTFVERCLQEVAGTFLEYALWKALTETTLDACCRYDHESIQSYLELANKLISSQALPIRLPRMGDTPILSRWITEVLQRLNTYWYRIACTHCRCSAAEPGMIQLRITRMTSGGTVEGQMICMRCHHVRDKATLLTHCHKCNHYPLIIGKNPVCVDCGGLVCEWRDHEREHRCKCCKKNCGQGQHTAEKDFV